MWLVLYSIKLNPFCVEPAGIIPGCFSQHVIADALAPGITKNIFTKKVNSLRPSDAYMYQ